jgi:hypothetical protein
MESGHLGELCLEGLKYVFYLRLIRKVPRFFRFNNTIGIDKEGCRERGYLVCIANSAVRIEQHGESQPPGVQECLHENWSLFNA